MTGAVSPGGSEFDIGPGAGGLPIVADTGSYETAAGGPPPPLVTPTPVTQPDTSPFGAVMAGASNLANADVASDNATGTEADLDRRGHAADAAAKFPAHEAQASAELQGVGAEGMAQSLPQMMSGLAGAVTGALGGVMGPLTQLPQQLFQAGQGAMQAGMGAFQGAGGGLEAGTDTLAGDAELLGDIEPGDATLEGAGGGGGGGGVGGGGGGTGPTGVMGPPPVPMSGAPTSPAAAPSRPAAVMPEGGGRPMSGAMGGGMMPMVPPGAMGAGAGAGGDGSKDKPVEKKIAAPGVPHGQPVKGRVTVPPNVPVAKSVEGKPVTPTTTKRYVLRPDTEDDAQR